MNTRGNGNIIPGMRFRDAPAAIEWLCRVFGFSRHLVVPDDEGGIAHAQLVLGRGMIMLGSAREGAGTDDLVRLPREVGAITQASYVVVEDIDGHYQHAVAEGAEIVYEITDQDYGGRLYSALDPRDIFGTSGHTIPGRNGQIKDLREDGVYAARSRPAQTTGHK